MPGGASPEGSLVTSIARNGEVLTPSGDVVLEAGDRLWLLGYYHPDQEVSGREAGRGPLPTPDDYNPGETGIAVLMCQVACVAYRSIGSEG